MRSFPKVSVIAFTVVVLFGASAFADRIGGARSDMRRVSAVVDLHTRPFNSDLVDTREETRHATALGLDTPVEFEAPVPENLNPARAHAEIIQTSEKSCADKAKDINNECLESTQCPPEDVLGCLMNCKLDSSAFLILCEKKEAELAAAHQFHP